MCADLTTKDSASMEIIVGNIISVKYARTNHVEVFHARRDTQMSASFLLTSEAVNSENTADIFMKESNRWKFISDPNLKN